MNTECFKGEMGTDQFVLSHMQFPWDKGGLINFIFDIGAVIKGNTQ